ncbi:MAG: hypothetical protein AB9869_34205 [Verrucomicrobiia bacterium]
MLSGRAATERRTPFTSQETDTTQDFAWFTDTAGEWRYLFDGKATFGMVSAESRLAGAGSYSMNAAVNIKSGTATLWGECHLRNEHGGWDGYWTGTEAQDGLTATLAGSGNYEGLVSRWTSTFHDGTSTHWRGYIVENGPGAVPFEISGWRKKQSVPPVTDPTMTPFFLVGPLAEGQGQSSPFGVFTDLKAIGLAKFTGPATAIFRATGIQQAANGDLLNWVALGAIASGEFKVSSFFAGGTGRFEHAVGALAVQVQPSEPSDTYTGTGTIRY